MAEQAAAGEFETTLRAQIVEAQAQLAQAQTANDLEAIAALGSRLRYLLGVAAGSGLHVDATSKAETDGSAGDGAGE